MRSIATLSRRRLAMIAAAAGMIPGSDCWGAQDNASLEALAEEAFIWGFSLVLTGRYCDLALRNGTVFNQYYVAPALATPPALKLAGPSIDTVYGYAWLDIAADPLVLQVPDTGDRYYAIQLLDAYANSFAYVGRRETGTKAGTYVITPPGWSGNLPPHAKQIKSPTSLVFSLVRTLVKGEADLPAALRIQSAYLHGPLSTYPHGLKAPVSKENVLNILPVLDLSDVGASFYDELSALLKAYPPSLQDEKEIDVFGEIGVGPGLTPSRNSQLAPILARGASKAFKRIRANDFAALGTQVNGWGAN